MELINHTPYAAAYNQGIQTSGRDCLVVVIKATFDLPDAGDLAPVLAPKQHPLHDSDAFFAKPGYSSPLYENDFATLKPRCDVLVHRPVAHAPEGEPAPEVDVALRLGSIDKRLRVLGPRHWAWKDDRLTPSDPAPFVTQPLSWEIAYGGVDETAYEDPALSDTSLPNPVGIGYRRTPDPQVLDGTPIAQTEALDEPITRPEQRPAPQGLGPIGRHWHPRSQYAGTYDATWLRERKPFLPDDFDRRYCQCAPQDQQMDYPQGGEPVELVNLTPEGLLRFVLPTLEVPLTLTPRSGGSRPLQPVIDTLTIDPERRQLTLVARAQADLLHSLHEISTIQVGHPPAPTDEADPAAATEAAADD